MTATQRCGIIYLNDDKENDMALPDVPARAPRKSPHTIDGRIEAQLRNLRTDFAEAVKRAVAGLDIQALADKKVEEATEQALRSSVLGQLGLEWDRWDNAYRVKSYPSGTSAMVVKAKELAASVLEDQPDPMLTSSEMASVVKAFKRSYLNALTEAAENLAVERARETVRKMLESAISGTSLQSLIDGLAEEGE